MYITITALLILMQNASASFISGSTPYNPQDGAKYYFEAQYDTPWPACNYRFMSYTDNCGLLDIWQAVGANQEITLIEQNEGWKLETTKCPGITVGYSTACGTIDIGTGLASSSADFSDIWRLVPSSTNFAELHFEAVNRDGCQQRYLTFNSDCSVHTFQLGTIEDGSDFLMHPVESSNPVVHHIATPNNEECADPFVWMDPDDANHPYRMICTGGDISLYSSAMLGRKDSFTNKGVMLGGDPGQTWASNANRWAPENIALGNLQNLAIFSAPQSDNVHRLGVVKSMEGAESGNWNTYSSSTLDLGGESGGDIDAHFFRDNGKIYLLWKTDDNAAGLAYTRLWINEVSIPVEGQEFLVLVGEPTMILDSRGLWWVDSWVANGSLIEGPQMLKHGTYYYLFFASGKYCQPSYSQGVARSMSIFGTYTKLGVPLLSTGIVGVGTTGAKLVGPGHASFVQDQEGQWFSVFHASEGVNCNRRPYVEKLRWSDDDWPVVVFDDTTTTSTSTTAASQNVVMAPAGNTCPTGYTKIATPAGCQEAMSQLTLTIFQGTEDIGSWPGGCYHCDNTVNGCTPGVWFNFDNAGSTNGGATPICAVPGWEDNLDLSVEVLFIGDSDIQRWDTAPVFPGSVNVGVGGFTCDDVNGIIDNALQTYTPKWVVIVCGENDLFGQNAETTFNDFKAVIEKIVASDTRAIYIGTKPEPSTTSMYSKYQNYDAKIRDYADALAAESSHSSPPLVMVDVYPAFALIQLGNPLSLYDRDELHLSDDGYEYWNTWTTTVLDNSLTDCVRWLSNVCDASVQFTTTTVATTTSITTPVATTAGTTTSTSTTAAPQDVVMAPAGNTCPTGYTKLTTPTGCQEAMSQLTLTIFQGTEDISSWPGGCYHCDNTVNGCTPGVWFNFANPGSTNGGATPICAVPGWEIISCVNDSNWRWTNRKGRKKSCNWVAQKESRCSKIGDDGTLALEACPGACNAAC